MPRASAPSSRPCVHAAGVTVRPYTPGRPLAGGETIEVAGIAFDVLPVPGHSPAHVAYHADGSLFSGDVLFAGSVGRVDLPGGDWDTLVSIRRARRHAPAETVVYPGHGPTTTLGAELARTRSSPSYARSAPDERRGDRAPARDARRRPLEAAGLARLVVGDRAPVRAVRLPADRTTPVFEDTALFERTSGAGVRRRPEGDVHVRGSQRTLSDLAPGGDRADLRAYLEHGLHREPQPVKLYTIATMYRYAAPQRVATASTGSFRSRRSARDDPSVDAEVIQLYDALLGRLGITRVLARAELDRLPRVPARRTSRLREWLAENEARPLDDETREKAATSPLRVSTTSQLEAGAVQRRSTRRRRSGVALRRVPRALRDRAARSRRSVASRPTLAPTLVRGLDYYTRTTWEFVGPLENENATLSGGGRYDDLVEEIGGPPPTRASASAPGSSGCCSRSRTREV